jgi:hypothetical protein
MAGGTAWGKAWVALTAALAVHVVDEAMTDFLGLWNPIVLEIRKAVPWSPLPVFSFPVWAGGLALLVVLLGALSIYGLRGARWLRPVAYAFGAIMALNALGHIGASLYLGHFAPGVTSSPLLLAAAAWLLLELFRSRRAAGHAVSV